MEAHRRGSRPGHPLNIVSTWTRWSIRVTVLVLVAGIVFIATVRVGEFAKGTAVVRKQGRVIVTSAVRGTVQSIEVVPRQRVEAGQILARLDDVAQRAELSRLEQEYRQQLIELLRNPASQVDRERLAELDARRHQAAALAAERAIIAPQPGVASDVRVRPGQPVAPGDAIVTIERESPHTTVLGLFPGHYRPLLSAEGTRLYLSLEGFPDSRREVSILSVADEVIGPAEAMRILGQDREGALELTGPVVLVEVLVPSTTFVADGVEYPFYDGMQGKLEARLRAETILKTLVPVLKKL